MSVGVFVEGPSDRPHVLRGTKELGFDIPVRAGHGSFQGSSLLAQWRTVVHRVPEQKIVFVFDRDKEADVRRLLAEQPHAVRGRTVVFLIAPWRGIEDFTEGKLEGQTLKDYESQRAQGASKRLLAQAFVGRLDAKLLREDPWLSGVFAECLRCRCPAGQTIPG